MARKGLPAVIAVAALCACSPLADEARGQTPGSTPPGLDAGGLVVPTVVDRPPPGRVRSVQDVVAVAERVPEVRRATAGRDPYARAFLKGAKDWQVGFYVPRSRAPDEEVAQVLVDDRTGEVLETWTGAQVAWTMARGYPGAFGRRVNSPFVWIPLAFLFLLPFLRPPLRMLHVDLLALLSLSVSYALFSAGEIGWSVPLAYPPLLYLAGRAIAIARARGRPGGAAARPMRLALSRDALVIGVIFLLGFRIGLNLTGSNVIDVGYAGVIGADRIAGGDGLYGGFPADNPRGDTYGPVAYLAYVPFEAALPWSGRWDALPAAHAAAIAFDLVAAALMWLAGRRLLGPAVGLLLAYLWLACPWTVLVANSNSNDSLVAVLVLAALLTAGRPLGRGAALAAASLTKFAPLMLVPLLATYRDGGARLGRSAVATVAAFAAAAALLLAGVALLDGGLAGFAERTVGFQLGRESPFSIWGLWNLGPLQTAAQALAAALAVGVAFRPRRRDPVSLAALAAAVLIATQLVVTHWFYLYVVWFLPPLLIAALGGYAFPGISKGSMESARPGAEQRITTALSHGSSSAGT